MAYTAVRYRALSAARAYRVIIVLLTLLQKNIRVKKQCRAIFTKAGQRRKDSFIGFSLISLFAGPVVSLAASRQLNVSR